jgi:hypothetical protein
MAYGELQARGVDDTTLRFAVTEMTETGAVHSETRPPSLLVSKYSVKSAPWLLMFRGGELIYSERPCSDVPHCDGGLGFVERLRHLKGLARPRALIMEPSFRFQLDTQKVLRAANFEHDLALNPNEARRMIESAKPPYGIFVGSSEVGVSDLEDVGSMIQSRMGASTGDTQNNSKGAVCIICHDERQGPIDEALQRLASGSTTFRTIVKRPLTLSQLTRLTVESEDLKLKYPQAGVTKDVLVRLLLKWLPGVSLQRRKSGG